MPQCHVTKQLRCYCIKEKLCTCPNCGGSMVKCNTPKDLQKLSLFADYSEDYRCDVSYCRNVSYPYYHCLEVDCGKDCCTSCFVRIYFIFPCEIQNSNLFLFVVFSQKIEIKSTFFL